MAGASDQGAARQGEMTMMISRIGNLLRHGAALLALVMILAAFAALACTNDDDDDDRAEYSSDSAAMISSAGDGSSQGIWVTGAGRVSVTPDIATLRIGVEANSETVGGAMAEAASSMQAVITSLTGAGISEEDIQTLTFNVSTDYEWNDLRGRSEMVGFTVTNTVRATIRNMLSIPGVIDGAVQAGGDNARVDGLSFSVDNTEDAEREARTLAMEAALEQATQLASLADVNLGEPFHVSESGAAPIAQDTPELMRASAMFDEAASTPILPGESDIVIYVRVGYTIG